MHGFCSKGLWSKKYMGMSMKMLVVSSVFVYTFITYISCGSSEQKSEKPKKLIVDTTQQIVSKDTAAKPISDAKANDRTMICTFENINAFEGNVSLIFKDETSKEIWFSQFDIDISKHSFYRSELGEDTVLPTFHVNAEKQGKKYKIVYKETKKEGEFSGEMEEVLVITGIEPLEQTAFDLQSYAGKWLGGDYQQFKDSEGNTVKMGSSLSLVIGSEGAQNDIYLISVGPPPMSRIAEIETTFTMEEPKTGVFKFDDDGWSNKGIGHIYFLADSIVVAIIIEERAQTDAQMFEGKVTFHKQN